MSLSKLALFWTCAAYSCCHGRRVQLARPRRRVRVSDAFPPTALEPLLLTLNPSSAFSPCSVGASSLHNEFRPAFSWFPGVDTPVGHPESARMLRRRSFQMSDSEEASDADAMDWREMRARLVAQEKAEQQEDGVKEGIRSGSGYFYESPLIEQGSVILCGTKRDFGFATRQQYFQKAVMLLISHDEVHSTGVILNRPTAHEIDGFRVWCGGDCQEGGLFRGDFKTSEDGQEIICLHTLEGNMREMRSMEIIKGVAYTDFGNAKDLISRGVAKQSDFWVFVGYAGWGPKQLQAEVDRGSWYLASADSGTLVQELLRQGTDLPPASTGKLPGNGFATWETLMQKIGLSEEVERTRACLADRVLSEWCRMRLVPAELRSPRENEEAERKRRFEIMSPKGMVLRAGILSDRGLLNEQFLHKSVLLVVGMLNSTIISVVLNRPVMKVLKLDIGDEPCRCISFGGNSKIIGSIFDIDRNGLMWLGQSEKLEPLSLGVDVGKSGLRRVTFEDVVGSLKEGMTELSDYLLVAGVTAFSRDELTHMLESGEFTRVQDARPVWPQLFELTDFSNVEEEGGAGLSDGTSVWWASGLLQKSAPGEQQASAAAAETVMKSLPVLQPTEMADEMLAEWLHWHGGHEPSGDEE